MFGAAFSQLVNDPGVSAIVLEVDSPGGYSDGILELSDRIYEARGRKPVVAVANHLMASAAYWIGTAADEVVASPSSEMGSIGAFAAHEDISKALEQEGIKVSLIAEGKYKIEGNPYEPLGEDARAAIQARVRNVYDAFVEAVARNRGVKVSDVRKGFGEGRVVGARQAVEMGMADRVDTLEGTIERLLGTGEVASKQVASGKGEVASENVESPDGFPSSWEADPVKTESETQAQRLRDEVNLFLQGKGVTHGTESSL
jgi:signal peptide peptidase SppA